MPTVTQDPEKPVEKEILADAIIKISHAIKSLNERSRLNRDAIVTLLKGMKGMSNVHRDDINLMLDNLEKLEQMYVVPVKKP